MEMLPLNFLLFLLMKFLCMEFFWMRHNFFHECTMGPSCQIVLQLSLINKILVLSLSHYDFLKEGKSFSSF